jgi:hypothetical protein
MTATNKITLVFCFLFGVAFASTANLSIKEEINKVGEVDEIYTHKDGWALQTNPPVFFPTNPPLSTPTPGSVVENSCVICVDGVTFHGEFEDDEGVTGTCPSAISRIATAFELGSEKCSIALNKLERLCCPTPNENPCNLCPDGITNDGNFRRPEGILSSPSSNTISASFRMYTCFDVDSIAKQFESGSETCTYYVDEFDICCGNTSPTPAENPTPGGVAFSGFGVLALIFIFWEVYAVGFLW